MWSRRPIQNPVTGSTSQVKELRAGHHDAFGNFVSATATVAGGTVTIPNRSLINQRAICPAVDTITVNGHAQAFNFPQTQGQERISTAETIRAFRMSLNTLGDGFIESIADQTLLNLASSQCSNTGGLICGETVRVPRSGSQRRFRCWPLWMEGPARFASLVLQRRLFE